MDTETADTTVPPAQLRSVLIRADDHWLMLPNASIAEVLSFAVPEEVEGGPEWLLGRIRWRGWRLPLVAFASAVGLPAGEGRSGNRVAVLKALGGDPARPYFALLTQGYPRLVTVDTEALEQAEDEDRALPSAVLARVRFRDDEVLVPDMEALENLIWQALPGQA